MADYDDDTKASVGDIDPMVIFDSREHFDFEEVTRELRDKYKENGVKNMGRDSFDDESLVDIQQLPIADIIILDRVTKRVLCLVEHKQPDDFKQSMQPGHLQPLRLYDQLDRMRGQNVPKLVLLFSGNFGNLPEVFQKASSSLTTRLAFAPDPIIHLRIESIDFMAHFVAKLLEQFRGKPREDFLGPPIYKLRFAVRKSQTDTPVKIHETVLQIIPGMSYGAARVVASHFSNLRKTQILTRRKGSKIISDLVYKKRHIAQSCALLISQYVSAHVLWTMDSQGVIHGPLGASQRAIERAILFDAAGQAMTFRRGVLNLLDPVTGIEGNIHNYKQNFKHLALHNDETMTALASDGDGIFEMQLHAPYQCKQISDKSIYGLAIFNDKIHVLVKDGEEWYVETLRWPKLSTSKREAVIIDGRPCGLLVHPEDGLMVMAHKQNSGSVTNLISIWHRGQDVSNTLFGDKQIIWAMIH